MYDKANISHLFFSKMFCHTMLTTEVTFHTKCLVSIQGLNPPPYPTHLFLLNHYFQKKDTLGKKKQHKKSRVVKRLTRKRVNFMAIKKQRRVSGECVPSPALLRVVNYLCQPFFKMLWRGLGMVRSTGKQVIIASSCKGGERLHKLTWGSRVRVSKERGNFKAVVFKKHSGCLLTSP